MSEATLAAETDVILKAEGIGKVFPGTIALRDVDFEVRRGAVNVLIGENGAGKSTLMKILAGVIAPTSGRLLLNGKEVRFDFGSRCGPSRHRNHLSGTEPLPESQRRRESQPRRSSDPFRIRHRPSAPGGESAGAACAPGAADRTHALADDLRIGQQQIVEIAKSLAADVDILIMDEPTSALSAPEVEILFRIIRDLKAHGVAIIYISHRLEEILRIGDYVTVLRDGRRQAHALVKDISVEWMVEKMVGPSDARRADRVGGDGKDRAVAARRHAAARGGRISRRSCVAERAGRRGRLSLRVAWRGSVGTVRVSDGAATGVERSGRTRGRRTFPTRRSGGASATDSFSFQRIGSAKGWCRLCRCAPI